MLISRRGLLQKFISNLILNGGGAASVMGSLLPKAAKLLICLLFLLNIRSWPLMWHCKSFRFSKYTKSDITLIRNCPKTKKKKVRIFRPVFVLRFQYYWVSICSMFKSASEKRKMKDKWFDSITPVGEHPFKKVVPYRTWASE